MVADSNLQDLLSDFVPIQRTQWDDLVRKDTHGKGVEPLAVKTLDGLHINPYYTHEDGVAVGLQHGRRYARDNGWAIRQDFTCGQVAGGTAMVDALAGGVEEIGLVVRHDHDVVDGWKMPAQPNDIAFPVHLVVGASVKLSAVVEYATRSDIRVRSFLVDPLSHYLRTGVDHRDAVYDSLATLATPAQRFGIDACVFHETGGSYVHELGFAAAALADLLVALADRGIGIEEAAGEVHFRVSVGPSLFLEIAKLRALRLLGMRILQASGASDPTIPITLAAQTSRFHQTRYFPYNNLIRATVASVAAVTGGCDSLVVSPFDSGSSDDAYRLARNTQLLLKYESRLHQVMDPSNGAYYVEAITSQLVDAAWQFFLDIEEQGGFTKSVSTGYVLRVLGEDRDNAAVNVTSGARKIVGVSLFPSVEDVPVPVHETDPTFEVPDHTLSDQVERVRDRTREAIRDDGLAPPLLVVEKDSVVAGTRATFAENFLAAGSIPVVRITDDEINFAHQDPKVVVVAAEDSSIDRIVESARSRWSCPIVVAASADSPIRDMDVYLRLHGGSHVVDSIKQIQALLGLQDTKRV